MNIPLDIQELHIHTYTDLHIYVTLYHEMSRNVPSLLLPQQGICYRGVKLSFLRFWL